MATKTPAKAPKTVTKTVRKVLKDETPVAEYKMPTAVHDWIERAQSRITYLMTEVDRLKEENKALRHAHKIMETRVMGVSRE
jgi:hypothetical protein